MSIQVGIFRQKTKSDNTTTTTTTSTYHQLNLQISMGTTGKHTGSTLFRRRYWQEIFQHCGGQKGLQRIEQPRERALSDGGSIQVLPNAVDSALLKPPRDTWRRKCAMDKV
jgi:hypothetical protein